MAAVASDGEMRGTSAGMPLAFAIGRYFIYAFAGVAVAWVIAFMGISAAINMGWVYEASWGPANVRTVAEDLAAEGVRGPQDIPTAYQYLIIDAHGKTLMTDLAAERLARADEMARAALAEMERVHMIVDVSHLNDRCFDEVAALTERPFVASHSNSRAVCSAPRNLTDSQFAEIRDRGGLVGLNFADIFLANGAPTVRPTFDDVSRHIDHWLELDGENIIALGSDFDGCDTPDVVADAARIPAFQELLAQRFGEDLTRKLCAENALAFFERWGN